MTMTLYSKLDMVEEYVSMSADPSMMGHRVVSPISTGHIIGEGAAIFTDMTETMLTALD